MERNLLVTVSEDLNSLYSVRFVASFFTNKRDIRITLLYMAPRFESKDAAEHLRLHQIDTELSEIYAKKGKKALETSRGILESYDFPPHKITTRLIHKKHGMVTDIMQEAQKGSHHAVILGQRGYSIFEKALHPGLPSEFVKHEIQLPIWICRRPRRGLKNVLLCIDGSQASQKITNHVVSIAGREKDHLITLFHVTGERSQDAKEILTESRRRLLDQGIEKERMKAVTVVASDVVAAIKQEASAGAYAAVAVGRRDITKESEPDKWFIGSNSLKLIGMLEKSALWVSK